MTGSGEHGADVAHEPERDPIVGNGVLVGTAIAAGLAVELAPSIAWIGFTAFAAVFGWWATRLALFPGVAEQYVRQHRRAALWDGLFGGESTVRITRAIAVVLLGTASVGGLAASFASVQEWLHDRSAPEILVPALLSAAFLATSWLTWLRRPRSRR